MQIHFFVLAPYSAVVLQFSLSLFTTVSQRAHQQFDIGMRAINPESELVLMDVSGY